MSSPLSTEGGPPDGPAKPESWWRAFWSGARKVSQASLGSLLFLGFGAALVWVWWDGVAGMQCKIWRTLGVCAIAVVLANAASEWCREKPGSGEGAKEDPWKRLDRLDGMIKFEFELSGTRVTYLAISQSFLFGAYIAAMSAYKVGEEPVYGETLGKVLTMLPWVGVALSSVVLAAVVCAASMIFKLKAARESLENEHTRTHRDISGHSLEHYIGLLPPLAIAASFLAAWLSVSPAVPKPKPAADEVKATTGAAVVTPAATGKAAN